MNLLDPLFGSEAVDAIFTDDVRLQRMLDFESALARAEAQLDIIPRSAAAPIASQCRADLFDTESLAQAAVKSGNLAIPMVRQLTELVGKHDKEAMRYVHWGATSQDAIDTGLVLQLRDGFDAIAADLNRLCDALVQLASTHRTTVVPARTWLQQAVPTTFGLKAAGWLDAMTRHRTRLQELRGRVLVLQFGGAAGTLASLGQRGLDVAKALANELKLDLPNLPWHAHRDRLAEVATFLALLTGTLGKIARDLALQMQTEIAEVSEPAGEGRGGSSTMPHKRNPVACAVVLSAAMRAPALAATMLTAMSQEHERGLGGWHAEWETLPDLFRLSAGALHRMLGIFVGLEVDTNRMLQNLEITHGLIYAEAVTMVLGKQIGKAAAHQLMESASRKAIEKKIHLREVLSADAEVSSRLTVAELEKLFDPQNYTGMASQFVDRAIAADKAGTR
ncbi:MAG: 3-carboxy-cis,cis-muconate cycloisomerase [Acidobacteria bacterium]|nr:MAG: 3-carboxy-cis,cis-muconate cycloisomerase [Acidobacteriota bacterium]